MESEQAVPVGCSEVLRLIYDDRVEAIMYPLRCTLESVGELIREVGVVVGRLSSRIVRLDDPRRQGDLIRQLVEMDSCHVAQVCGRLTQMVREPLVEARDEGS